MSLVTTSVNGVAAGGKTRLTGGNPSPAPAKSPRPPMPHISDLTSVSAGVDPNLPIRKLLEEGHGCMRQAETFRNFGRPDVALQEYIRCSIIVVEIIPHHKERVSLRDDRGGLGRLYEALKVKVHNASPDFERIKEEIKKDNERTGVQPSNKTTQGQAPGHARAKPSVDNNIPRSPVPSNGGIPNNLAEANGRPPRASPPKAKPVIHPKPQSLHGNSVKPSQAGSRATTDVRDLNARSLPPIPPGDSLTPEQLADLMKTRSSSILMIDVRPRVDFEEGHILSQTTICIEPSVLLRDNISADNIAESNILAPSQEQQQFERRDKFEVVVLYDQDSQSIPSRPVDEAGTALMSLRRALLHFSYGRELKNPPKLLKGGLDAWVDFMGPQSLGTTSSRSQTPLPRPGSTGAQDALVRSTRGARRQPEQGYVSLKPEEVKKWEETVRRDDMDVSQSPNFVRSTEEFFRRFPPVGDELESMTSPMSPSSSRPSSPPSQSWRETGHDAHHSYNDLPSPPTRPAPAVPRPSYSGLGQRYDGGAYMAQSEQPDGLQLQPPAGASGAGTHFTGLINATSTWCYANSTLQALRMTDGFGQEVAQFKKVNNWPPPRGTPSPQLMMNILANLFQWMALGCFKAMRAQTLMEYSYHKTKGKQARFGGRGREDAGQQDAEEYLHFLFMELAQETNRVVKEAVNWQQRPTGMQTAVEFWREYTKSSKSIIDRYFAGVEVTIYTCLTCNTASRTANETLLHSLTMKPDRVPLDELIKEDAAGRSEPGYACEKCKSNQPATVVARFARMPDILVITLKRFHASMKGNEPIYFKNMQSVDFDVDDINFESMFLQPHERGFREGETAPAGGNFAPARYQCYGIVMHRGAGSINQGHYYSYVRALGVGKDREKIWYKCNDDVVSRVRIGGSGPLKDVSSDVFTNQDQSVPYVLYFRRKGWTGRARGPAMQETSQRGD
ncbi:uncharacterized protein DNG_07659 [Cephalotrichum gorgonifer]|uniref:Uncharacterized protein n=1 Tax=Cephalotrichum gorgonifer TaxID=2041049 RepID=A0AAE8N3T9_9PEZI|nr:uncharacterized protein DNG_07659 [Cephalotrichum gorgonifer]